MKAKRLLSVVLAVAVVLSCVMALAFAPSASAASEYNEYAKMLEAIKPENNYGLEDTVNDGKIIQAWNWSYANIIANLETLAEQGFTTIQVSPPNELKMPTKDVKVCEPAVDGIAPNGWWMFYQPAGFQLNESEDNALGTKAEYVKMCEEAHKLGLKVIADAVINHMGTDDDHIGEYTNTSTDPMDHVNSRAAEFEPELLAAKAFHSPWVNMTYKENYWDGYSDYDIEEDLTQHCTSGLPDLATETQLVQDVIYEYFVELVEAGTDGFRFDAAKHIETKHDTYFASDFWENTLLKLRANYPDVENFAYGEILNKCGDGRPFSEYTELMDVTDSSSYWGIKSAVQSNGTDGNPIPYYPNSNFTKANVIQWNESHDTYIDGGTSSLTVMQRNKIWALTAARQEITGVYFARPDDRTGADRAAIEKICADIVLGEANKTSWANPEVAAVNQFDNYFGDVDEYNSVQSYVTMIERGGLGATLVNLNGTTKNVNIKAYTLAEGTYIDAITGAEFEVAGGKLTGKIGTTGIACIYYAEDTEPVGPDLSDVDIWDVDVSSGNYPVAEGYNTVVYSAKSNWTEAYVYAWMKGTDINNGDWPGNPMKFALINDYGERQYVAYIPVEYDCYIINNGKGNNDPGGAQTVDLSVTSSVGMYMDKQGSDGKWTIGTWSPNFYDLVIPDKTEPTTVVTEPSSEVTGSTETTAESSATEPSSTIPADGYLLGDADSNGKVNVKDATAIQKVIALLEVSNYNNKAANVDGNAFVNVKDATMIQKWVALLLPDSDIGTLVK
ncbi:MAG: starch-binding protein [Clostridia bacterium]|nr:starch-binding protein [Clostridia bacterium]